MAYSSVAKHIPCVRNAMNHFSFGFYNRGRQHHHRCCCRSICVRSLLSSYIPIHIINTLVLDLICILFADKHTNGMELNGETGLVAPSFFNGIATDFEKCARSPERKRKRRLVQSVAILNDCFN